jgi:hypothetical protein
VNYFFVVPPAGFFASVFFGVVLPPVPVAVVSVVEPVPAGEPVDVEPVADEPVDDGSVPVGEVPVGEVPVVLGALPVGDAPIDDGDVVLGVDVSGVDDEDVEVGSVALLVVWVSGALAGSLLPPQARALATSRAAAKIETFMRDSPFWVVRAVSFRVWARGFVVLDDRSPESADRTGAPVQCTCLTREWERNARVLMSCSIVGVSAATRLPLLRGIRHRVESSR